MTDRVHPSAKSNTNAGSSNTSLPATKAQLYGATRPTYRPRPSHRRSSSRCCCTLCFWLIVILLFLLLLLGAAGTVLYFLYHPHRPSFSVTSLKLSSSEFDLKLYATNPNNKISFYYEPTSVSILTGDVDVGDGVIPSFEHAEKNTTVMKASLARSNNELKGNMELLKVKLETKVEAKMSVFKTPRVGIRVVCDGIHVDLPTGEKPAAASTANTACEVVVRFKVWKWTLG